MTAITGLMPKTVKPAHIEVSFLSGKRTTYKLCASQGHNTEVEDPTS